MELSIEAANIMNAFTDPDTTRQMWTVLMVTKVTYIPMKPARKALNELIEAERLNSVYEVSTKDPESLLCGVPVVRPYATYYMLPKHYKALVEAQEKRLRDIVWRDAEQQVLEAHRDTVKVVFDELWARTGR